MFRISCEPSDKSRLHRAIPVAISEMFGSCGDVRNMTHFVFLSFVSHKNVIPVLSFLDEVPFLIIRPWKHFSSQYTAKIQTENWTETAIQADSDTLYWVTKVTQ